MDNRSQWYGWWGEPWPSGVCIKQDENHNDTDEWNWGTHVETPVGSQCSWCNETIVDGDQGQNQPALTCKRTVLTYVHRECMLRQVVGGINHLNKTCSCHSGEEPDIKMSLRDEALEVWRIWTQ